MPDHLSWIEAATLPCAALTAWLITVGHRDRYLDMMRAISLHRLRPMVDRIFPLDEPQAAPAYLRSGQHIGKVCIEI